jgi:hypothetical protein
MLVIKAAQFVTDAAKREHPHMSDAPVFPFPR